MSDPQRPNESSRDPHDDLADLLDEALALDDVARERFLRGLEARDPDRGRELRELIAMLPDAEPREAAERAERGEQDPFVGEPAVGETLGGCVIEEILGRGGIGTVFGARQIDPPRAVAIKILRMASARASHLRRFRTEAHALGRLVHPTLARIYASGTAVREGVELPYIIMERIDDAVSFVEWARSGRVSRVEIARSMALSAFTLAAALPVGLALAWLLLAVVNVEAFGWRLPMHVFPLDWLRLLVLALISAGLAAVIPALRLLRLSPSDLLKVFAHER